MVQKRNPHVTGRSSANNDEDLPPPPSLIILKTAVYLMGVMLVVGFAVLIYTLVSRMSQPKLTAAAPGQVERVVLQPGESIHSVALDRNLMALHVKSEDGKSAIIVHDISRGQTVRRITIVKP